MKQIREWLDLPVIEIDHAQCLNEKSPRAICEKCVHACPTKALTVKDKEIVFKEKACIDCTACVSACPTLSIDYMPKPYTKTINEIKAYPDADITCNQFDKYQKGIKVPCYLTIDHAMLMHYFKSQGKDNVTLELFVGKCKGCKYEDSFDIYEHINNLKKWCQELGIPVMFKLVHDPHKFLEKQSEVVSGMTRRSLFKSLGFGRASESENEKESEQSVTIDADVLSYDQKNQYKQRLITTALEHASAKKAIAKSKSDMPTSHFAMVNKTDPCRKCNVCMRICPTEALEWVDGEDKAKLYFYPKKCIACGRCKICPEGSISLTPICSDVYHSQDKIQIAKYAVSNCEDCGESFKSNTETETSNQRLCELCKLKEEKKRALFDSL